MISEAEAIGLTATVTHFTEHAQWTGVTSKERESWLGQRRSMLSASDVACIMDFSPFGDALSVFVEKTTAPIARAEPSIYTPMFWGSVLEQPILRAAAQFYGWDYHEGGALLRSRHFGYLGCTLDAEIDRHDGLGWIDLEGKTATFPKGWDENAGTLPPHILIQAQAQLLVTGAPRALVFGLLQGSRPCQVEVFPNVEYHAAIVEHGQQFMERVARLDPPMAGALSGDALDRMFPSSDGSIVALPAASVQWSEELVSLNVDLAKLAKRKEELRNMLRQAIGSCTFGELPEPVNGKRFWRWIESEREAYTVEARSERSLLALKGATLPGQKAGVGPVRIGGSDVADSGSDDLAEGETVTRLHKRRR